MFYINIMGSASSRVDNQIMNQTINKTLNQTTMKMIDKTELVQEEDNVINQSIKLVSPKEKLVEMRKEAAEMATIMCTGSKEVGKCVKDIMESMVPPTCAGGLNISQTANIESETSAKLRSVNTKQLEKQMKEALKTEYDNQQKGKAKSTAGMVGRANSRVRNKVSNKTVNQTINQISMEMRNELEMFQKKNNDQTQAIVVEMFPGMGKGGCNFSQDAAVKSLSNIGTAKAMQIIAKVTADKKSDTKAKTKQTAEATSSGPSLPNIIPILIAVAVIGGGAYFYMESQKKKKKSGGSSPATAPSSAAPSAAPVVQATPVSSARYQVGQVITLANGQKALIQSFGKKKIIA